MTEIKWWDTHDNIAILAHWMADEGYAAQIVADMVEKPWHWSDEWEVAQAEAQEAAEDSIDWDDPRFTTLREAEAVQEAAWEALKAAAPVEHAAHCASVGGPLEATQAALAAFHAAAPAEAAAYEAAVMVAITEAQKVLS